MNNAAETQNDLESLRAKYCPPLDEALFFAIASDFSLQNEAALAELRQILDSLKGEAVIEQELELLPPGACDVNVNGEVRPHGGQDVHGSIDSRTGPAASQTVSNQVGRPKDLMTDMENLNLSGSEALSQGISSGYGDVEEAFDDLAEDKKLLWMQGMFPNVSSTNILLVLNRCHGKFEQAADELLNVSFLNDQDAQDFGPSAIARKGVDAFAATSEQSHRKHRARNRRRPNRVDRDLASASDSSLASRSSTPASQNRNAWNNLSEDVKFIALRTSLLPSEITSAYHAHGAKLSSTIKFLVSKQGETYLRNASAIDHQVKAQVDEIGLLLPTVPVHLLYGALVLADKIPTAAKELLDRMTRADAEPVIYGKVHGLASYAPIRLDPDEEPPKPVGHSAIHPPSAEQYTTSYLANTDGIEARRAFEQAAAAYKRGKSDHLMGGAAAYYAQVGHERLEHAKQTQAAAADALVLAQSSRGVLDLHGVNVSDAVRIASDKTESWWQELGDRKLSVGGIGNGFRIVTGVGRHSTDGLGRLGPAVSKMLVRNGWKISIQPGEIIVSGRARKGV